MKDQARRHIIDELVELATEHSNDLTVVDRNGRTLTERMDDALLGHPKSPNLDPGTSGRAPVEDLADELRGSLGYSDPTGSYGVQAATFGDRAKADQRQNDKDLLSALKLLRAVRERSARYKARTANPIERLEKAESGCFSCARVSAPGSVGKQGGTPYWNPIFRMTTLVDGSKVGLCSWCYSGELGVRKTGELPPREDVESYRDTGRARKRRAS